MGKRLFVLVASLCAILAHAGDRYDSSPTPSFDCAKAATRVERLICSDDQLAHLDFILAERYGQLRADPVINRSQLLQQQRQWLRLRTTHCLGENEEVQGARGCLIDLYTTRLDEFSTYPRTYWSPAAGQPLAPDQKQVIDIDVIASARQDNWPYTFDIIIPYVGRQGRIVNGRNLFENQALLLVRENDRILQIIDLPKLCLDEPLELNGDKPRCNLFAYDIKEGKGKRIGILVSRPEVWDLQYFDYSPEKDLFEFLLD